MAGRKTDFNTEDIMGSLLGRTEPAAPSPIRQEEPPQPLQKRPARKEKENKVPVSFSMTRSMAEDLKRIAYVDRVTCSEIICQLVDEYIKGHQASLREYDRIARK